MATLSRRHLAKYVAKHMNTGDTGELVQQLAAYLVEHKQTKQLDLLYADITRELEQNGTYSLANVTTARPLSDDQRQNIRDFLQKALQVSNVELSEHIDADLIGGAVITTADAEFDSSIRTQLNNLKKA